MKASNTCSSTVSEDRGIKADVTKRAEAQLAADAVFACKAHFIGLHCFSPVDRMPLVEIIVGKDNSDDRLARGCDPMLQIRQMCEVCRIGKEGGKGPCGWDQGADGNVKSPWPCLATMYPMVAQQPAQRELIDRLIDGSIDGLMFAQANETVGCPGRRRAAL